jgi:hypothetical protein
VSQVARTLPYKPRVLNSPRYRPLLIRDLAAGDALAVVGERYGVHPSSVHEFAQKYASEIERQRAGLADEFAALWVANKGARIAELQRDVERLDREIRKGQRIGLTPQELAPAYQSKHRALEMVAKELGAYRQVVDVNVTTVKYEIVGVEVGELR